MPGSRRLDLPTVQGPDHEERMERTRVREKTRARGVCAPQTPKRSREPQAEDRSAAPRCAHLFVWLSLVRKQPPRTAACPAASPARDALRNPVRSPRRSPHPAPVRTHGVLSGEGAQVRALTAGHSDRAGPRPGRPGSAEPKSENKDVNKTLRFLKNK